MIEVFNEFKVNVISQKMQIKVEFFELVKNVFRSSLDLNYFEKLQIKSLPEQTLNLFV